MPAAENLPASAHNQVVIKWKENLRTLTPQQKLRRTVRQHAHRPLRRAETQITANHQERNFSVVESRDLSTDELIRQFEDLPTVEYAHENLLFYTQSQTTPWGIDSDAGVDAISAHDAGITGSGTVVAIIDSGVTLDHPDLDANIWSPTDDDCTIDGTFTAGGCPNGGYDFSNDDNDPTDDHGHGTHVAGTVAAEDNDDGVVGVAPDAQIMAVKVLGEDGYGEYTTIVQGIDFAVDNGADVINLSLGAMSDNEVLIELQDAIADAESAGVTVVAAAGNFSTNVAFLPSQFETVLSVGAVQETASQDNPEDDYNTRLGYLSNFGKISVVAPGIAINSTTYDGLYSGDTWNGTSMASPHVAGIVALLRSEDPALTPAEIRHIIEASATDTGDTGKDEFFGSGIANADAAVDALDDASGTLVLEANWSENSSEESEEFEGYYVEPTVYSTILPADGASETTLRMRAAQANGVPLAGEGITIETTGGTLDDDSVTTDSNGFAEFTVTADNTAGTATVTGTLTSTSTIATVELHFADTLLVTDAGQPGDPGNEGWYMARALTDLGEEWMMSNAMDPEDETSLDAFDRVVWHTGRYGLNETEQENIKNYLDDGGNIFLSGGDILYTYYYYSSGEGTDETQDEDIIFEDYLNVSYSNYFAAELTFVGSDDFEGIGAELEDFGSDSANSPYADVISAGTDGEIGGYFCSNAEDTLVSVSDTYRSTFLGVALEIVEKTDREEIIENALAFLSDEALPGGSFERPSACDSADGVDDGTAEDPEVDPSDDELPEPGQTEEESESDSNDVLFSLSVDAIDETTATLSWETDEALSYSIVYAENAADGRVDTSALGDATAAEVTDLQPGITYNFNVYGVYADDSFTAVHTVTGSTQPEAPSKPTLVKAKRKKIHVSLTDPSSSEDQFRVELDTEDGDAIEIVTLDNGETETTFTGLSPGTTYKIRAQMVFVDAQDDEITSDFSGRLTTKTTRGRVEQPVIVQTESTRARIQWLKPAGKIKRYVVQLWEKRSGVYTKVRVTKIIKHLKRDAKDRWVKNLSPHTKYRVRVRALFKDDYKGRFSKYRKFTTSL
jgi:subtilisin